jgi:hypothetical protein
MANSVKCMKDSVRLVLEDNILHSNTFSSGIWKEVII